MAVEVRQCRTAPASRNSRAIISTTIPAAGVRSLLPWARHTQHCDEIHQNWVVGSTVGLDFGLRHGLPTLLVRDATLSALWGCGFR